MKTKEFFGKFCSLYLWGNLFAMVLVVVGLCFGVKYGLELYTHHGEGIKLEVVLIEYGETFSCTEFHRTFVRLQFSTDSFQQG